ncbi:fumarylacetoacetate hydrolase family protein [Virgisporangium aurantiacum]|uniref:5-carboxymethyl-2-hydroxymuconate isomerase n=1 Tax=Virgisporangium aurantiacum TaxID=175570 RepID=A0A8J4E0L4_9ACTN|nr:fumarylacetoacetate hydrolase family protein [Virgisporangium aurantiacum]GIJ56936.1 5-carboxymethyl-2-hydroxymuconate isomerase [Virgisporangium aurantiacum]
MRLATVRTDTGTRAARVAADDAVLLPAADLNELLRMPDWESLAADDGPRFRPREDGFAPAVPRPNKIVCLGLNYRSHISEMGREPPAFPTLFAKFDGALIGAFDPIALPSVSDQVDWEAELGVVIGRPARRVDARHALDHVAGYTVVNDVTARDWQHRTREFLSGKTFEATTPVGPYLVTRDEFPDGEPDLAISCAVDGVVMQSARTGDLLFGVAETIAYISQIITLLPGDLIATGTPGGVGAGRDPRVFLTAGQEVVTTIEGVGTQRNRCTR